MVNSFRRDSRDQPWFISEPTFGSRDYFSTKGLMAAQLSHSLRAMPENTSEIYPVVRLVGLDGLDDAWDFTSVTNTPFRKTLYFLYGSLMDPRTLAKVLQTNGRLFIQPAKLDGYNCLLWGRYPALLEGQPGSIVHGVVYEVQSPEEEHRLQEYETDHYLRTDCWIELADSSGRKVLGKTFKWAEDSKLLKEGTFVLKDWQIDDLERKCWTALLQNG